MRNHTSECYKTQGNGALKYSIKCINQEVDPIPSLLQIVKPKGWKPPKIEFRPKLPVLRKQSRHVETEMEPAPSPGNMIDVIIENAEFLNEIKQAGEVDDEANDPIQSQGNDEGNVEKTTPKRTPKTTPKENC